MLKPEEELLTDEDRRAVAASREFFSRHPEGGVSLDRVAAECGLTMEQIRDSKE